MPEENKAAMPLSSESATAQQRMRTLDRILLVGLLIAVLTVASYILLYFQTQAWQILAVAVGVAAGAACLLPARRQLKRNDLYSAGNWSLAAIVLAFGVGEVFWTNNTFFATVGALFLFLLIGSLVRPRHWRIWLAIAVAYGGFIVAVNQFQPVARFDIARIQLLNAFIPIAIGVLTVTLLWFITRDYSYYSLRLKLLVAFLVVSLISVGGAALVTDRTIRLALEDQASSELTNLAQLQGATIGDLMDKETDLLQTLSLDETILEQARDSNASYQGTPDNIRAAILALDNEWIAAVKANDDNNPLIQSKLNNNLAAHLRDYRAAYPENVEVFVTDRYGALLGATNRTSDYYQADEDWWQAAFNNGQGAVYLAQPEYDESSGTFSVDIAVPLYERGTQNIVGVIRTTFDMATILSLLSNTQIGQTGRVEMLFPYHGIQSFLQTGGAQHASADVLADLPTGSSSISEVDWTGVPSFAAVAPVRSTSQKLGNTIDQLAWRLIAHQSRSEVLAPVEFQTRTVLLIMLLVAAIVSVASIGLSQLLVRPIAHLTNAAQKVSGGDLTVQAPVETGDEIGTLAVAFNNMTAQLRNMVESLEDRVQERTEQLRASADVGRTAVSVLDPDQLLHDIVNLITERFGFYYTAVFTADDSGRYAVLRDATGEAGRVLKARGHRLEIGGRSMVGTAIARRRLRIALDVENEAVRFANPLLPETRSEIALPLIVGERVFGALDVQSTQVGAFDEASAAVLQSMADQIAIALHNATSYAESQAIARQSRALYAASSEVGRLQPDLAGTIGAMMRGAAGNLLYDRWCVMAFDETRNSLIPIATQDWPDLEQPLSVITHSVHPLVRSALRNEALLIQEPDTDTRLQGLPSEQRANLFRLISVPVDIRGTLVGALALGRTAGAPLTAEDLEIGRSLASLAAVAIENHRLLETTQRTFSELDAVNRRLTGESWEAYTRRRTKDGILWVSRTDKAQPQLLPEIGEALSSGRVVTRVLDDPTALGVAVPIQLRGVPVGALRLTMPRRAWNNETEAALQSIAGHVAQASENARLLSETEQRFARERALTEAADKVRRNTDVERVLETAAAELARYLNASRVAVRLTAERGTSDGNGQ